MNEQYLDRVVARWLRDGPAGSPPRILDAAIDHARTHPHRPIGVRLIDAIRVVAGWRMPMPGSRFATVASSVALVVAMTTFIWVAGRPPVEPPVPILTDSPAPMVTYTPAPEVTDSPTAAPGLATCPPGTDPDSVGSAQQARPRGHGVAAAFDRDSGRVVAAFGYTIWTYDVCRNEWSRSATELPNEPEAAVYDPLLDLTVFIGQRVSTYDADSDTLEQRGLVPNLGEAVLRRATNEIFAWDRWTATLWQYDVARDSWAEVPQGGDVPPMETSPLLAYDPSVDRLVLYQNASLPWSYEFDFASSMWQNSQSAPDLFLIWGDLGAHEMAYDESLARSVAFSRGKVIAYDATTHTWEVLFDSLMEQATEDDPPDPTHRQGATLVFDPINSRLLAIGGHRRAGDHWYDNDDVLAFDSAARAWRQLLPPSHPDGAPLASPRAVFSCPPGADPNTPGPADQVGPASVAAATFDRGSGRIVAIGFGSSDGTRRVPGDRIWTFDVCTNTWSSTDVSPYPTPESAVYDPSADRVVFIADRSVWTYDTDTGVLEALGDTAGVVGQAIYRTWTGQVIIRDPLGLWEYDVATSTSAELPQSGDVPPDATHSLLAYDSSADQLVLYSRGASAASYIFGFGTYEWTRLEPDPPLVDFLGGDLMTGEMAYDDAHALTVVASGGRVVTFDPSMNQWSVVFEARTAAEKALAERYGARLVYDSVNERIVALGGSRIAPPGSGWGTGLPFDARDIVAFDLGTNTWITLYSSPD